MPTSKKKRRRRAPAPSPIRLAREAKQLSQGAFERKYGVPQSTLQRLERQAKPDPKLSTALAVAFGLDSSVVVLFPHAFPKEWRPDAERAARTAVTSPVTTG